MTTGSTSVRTKAARVPSTVGGVGLGGHRVQTGAHDDLAHRLAREGPRWAMPATVMA